MGGTFSGWHGRRSSRPYFDELPRLAVGDCKSHPPGPVFLTAAGRHYTARLIRIPVGFCRVPRLVCATCGRAVRVLYLRAGEGHCCRCTDARYRTTSESPSRRAVRRAEKIWRRAKIDIHRLGGKPKWMRWPTFERLQAAADAVWPIIERDDCAGYELLARLDAPRRKRGRPPKVR
ncbi:MAG: hypothetical protein OHM77_06145 [Candidatus Nitricoxidivorans perseverans]|uniref:Uncharacterized protein n=1 Tax=Candidatus Nitricoxidivorans perseverans TaxID=2975601 RepID=A0AA49FN19_9PROT|nr:MAG: hypothetical protein OHM77_06145 [Candidatus Nitricoxidivorans perseverans]